MSNTSSKIIWGGVLALTALVCASQTRSLIKNINKKFEDPKKDNATKTEQNANTQTA